MLGEKLKKIREEKGFLQKDVAKLLNIDITLISKIENCDKLISRNHLNKLANFYNVEISELTTLWLSDKIFELIKNEEYGFKSLEYLYSNMKKTK
ncbi:helix-turn-helix domain-containing protein [Empedobacter falsenii]